MKKLIIAAFISAVAASSALADCVSSQAQADFDFNCAAGLVTHGTVPGTAISNGCGGSGGGGGGETTGGGSGGVSGGSSFSMPVSGSYVPTIVPNPPAIPATPDSCQSPSTQTPRRCDNCPDAASGVSSAAGDPAISVPNFAGPVNFRVFYVSENHDSGDLGKSWRHNFESSITIRTVAKLLASGTASGGWSNPYDPAPAMGPAGMYISSANVQSVAVVRTLDGRRLVYTASDGQWLPPSGESARLSVTGSTAAPTGYVFTTDDNLAYSYDAGGRLASITDRNGGRLAFEYSGGGLSAVKDPDNRTLYTFARDGGGRVVSATDLGGRTHTFSYNDSNLLSRLEGPEGVTTYGYTNYAITGLDSFAGAYFASGGWGGVELLTQITSPDGAVTAYSYGAPSYQADHTRDCKSAPVFTYGGAPSERCPLAPGTSAPPSKIYLAPVTQNSPNYYAVDKAAFASWYFPQKYYLASQSGPAGTSTSEYIVDEQTNEGETRITTPTGKQYVYHWHNVAAGFRRDYAIDPAGGKTLYAYDSSGNPAQVTDPAGNVRKYVYDAKNRLTSATDPLNNRINIGYEPTFGQISYYADAKGNTTHYGYDATGNLTTVTDAAGRATSITNNAHGLPLTITDPLNHSITFARDAYGNATSITDALNRTANFTFDTVGRVTRMTDPMNKPVAFAYNLDNTPDTVTDALGGVTRYGYEPGAFEAGAKRLNLLTDAANHATAFAYDAQGRLSSVTDPLTHAVNYSYDAAGKIAAVTDANANHFTFSYDNLDRLSAVTAPDGQTSYTYDAANNLTAVENPQSKLQFGYAAAGRMTAASAVDKANTIGGMFTYTYDAAGNRLSMTMAASPAFTWNYTYDAMNRPVAMTSPDGTQFQFTYDAAGRRTHMDMGTTIGADYAYDAANQLTSITYRRKTDNAVIATAGYTYDNAGNRTGMTDDFGNHTFDYDDLHRLTSAVHPSSGALSVQSETFAYDAVGNRTQDAVRTGYAYDAANRLNSDSQYTYAYDNNGNLTTRTKTADNTPTTYTYDTQNRLTQVTRGATDTATYRYDALGRRIAKTVTHAGATVADKHFIYDGNDIVAITDAAGSLKTMYTHGPGVDEPLMLRKGTSNYFTLADGLGSIIAVADQTGNIIERTQYQAYGHPVFENATTGSTTTWSTTGNIYSYTGREYDTETGLFYYRARYYDPNTGRFIQKDPIGFKSGDTNLYAYVYNNPPNLTDSWGLSAVDVQRIRDTFDKTIDIMNREKKRYPVPAINNLLAYLHDRTHGRLGKPYLICAFQTERVLDALRKEQNEHPFDDKWDFKNIITTFHEYATATSANPADPIIKLDPLWNSFEEIDR